MDATISTHHRIYRDLRLRFNDKSVSLEDALPKELTKEQEEVVTLIGCGCFKIYITEKGKVSIKVDRYI